MKAINDMVLEGKDGWLFLFQGGHKQFDHLLGLKDVSNQSITNFSTNIDKRIEFCKKKNIIYKHVSFPSKPLVKTEYLPVQIKVQSLFCKFYEPILTPSARESIYYPLDDLRELEKESSTFLKYDTHMSSKGNYAISKYLLGLLNISEKPELWTISKKPLGGDLSNMLKIPEVHEEEVISLKNQKIAFEIGNREFLKSNTNEVLINHCGNPETDLRLLIFGDSFFKSVIPFLKPYFKDIMYVRSSNIEYDIAVLYKPDIIFTGNAERYLSHVRLDGSHRSILWNLYGDISFCPSNEYIEALSSELSFSNYQNIYQKWAKKVEKETFSSVRLGKFITNKDVKVVKSNHYLKFHSTGTDPYIVYSNIDLIVGQTYILTVSMISSVNSTFQVFFVDDRVKPYIFTQKNSIKEKIYKGVNKLELLLDFKFLGKNLELIQ